MTRGMTSINLKCHWTIHTATFNHYIVYIHIYRVTNIQSQQLSRSINFHNS